MFKKLVGILLTATLFVCPVMLTTGCKQIMSGETATQQIMEETKDPVAIARAAYLDGLSSYTQWLEKYVNKYQSYMMRKSLGTHQEIVQSFDKMDEFLDMWDGLSQLGVTPERGHSDFISMLQFVSNAMLEIDAELEKNKGAE
jgi:hypothetical protein